jgi:tRNA G10  N-methylase Trm11
MRSQTHMQAQCQSTRHTTSATEPTSRFYTIYNVDAFEWLKDAPMNSIQAVVTDPPYALVEYSDKELISD